MAKRQRRSKHDYVDEAIPAPRRILGGTLYSEFGLLVKGDETKVAGRGTFVLHSYVKLDDGREYVTVYGGSSNPNAVRAFRSVLPDEVKNA